MNPFQPKRLEDAFLKKEKPPEAEPVDEPAIPHKVKKMQKVFGKKCFYCFKEDATTADHFIPRSLGGKLVESNIVPACRACNVKKGNKLPSTNDMARHREFWRAYKAKTE